jgi:hypothetical protein
LVVNCNLIIAPRVMRNEGNNWKLRASFSQTTAASVIMRS